jgi:hypothetical protein
MWKQLNTVNGLAEFLEVTPGTVRTWIRSRALTAERRGAQYYIPQDLNSEFVLQKLNEKHNRPDSPFVPKEIEAYEKWHTVLDEFSWLVKVTYSSREELRARRFRLDSLLTAYLSPNLGNIAKIGRFLGTHPARNTIVSADLRRGWYNELAFAFPLKTSTLGLTFADIHNNRESSDNRFVFPSWRIVSAYYACYFYLRSLTVQKEPAVNLQRHDATINAFKYNVVSVLGGNLWAFPFDVSWTPRTRVYRRQLPTRSLPHLRYQYAVHPRAPYRSPDESFEFIYEDFRRRGKQRKNITKYTVLDFIREFRVWANYIDIDNLLSLWGSGYKAFLDQNLSAMIFFIAAISEFGFMAVRGSGEYLRELQAFHDRFICNNLELEKRFTSTPTFQRMIIFSRLGITNGTIKLRSHVDPNAVLI